MPENTGANATQVGGQHYKTMGIQPWDYALQRRLPYVEGQAIKYVTRWRAKGGVQDLEKAAHMLQKLIEWARGDGKDDLQSCSPLEGAPAPIDYAVKNGLGFVEGQVVYLVTRWSNDTAKNVQHLIEASDMLDLLIQHEKSLVTSATFAASAVTAAKVGST